MYISSDDYVYVRKATYKCGDIDIQVGYSLRCSVSHKFSNSNNTRRVHTVIGWTGLLRFILSAIAGCSLNTAPPSNVRQRLQLPLTPLAAGQSHITRNCKQTPCCGSWERKGVYGPKSENYGPRIEAPYESLTQNTVVSFKYRRKMANF